jgi:hypothetical protein
MGILGNGLKGNIFTGLAIGIGAAVLAPAILPVLAGAAKPLVKAAIKGGIMLYEKGKENFAEVGEVVEDLVAEVKAELAEPGEEVATPPAPPEA